MYLDVTDQLESVIELAFDIVSEVITAIRAVSC